MGTNILNTEITPSSKIDKKSKDSKVDTKKESTGKSLFDQILEKNKPSTKEIPKNTENQTNSKITSDTKKIPETTNQKSNLSLLDTMIKNLSTAKESKSNSISPNKENIVSKVTTINELNTIEKIKSSSVKNNPSEILKESKQTNSSTKKITKDTEVIKVNIDKQVNTNSSNIKIKENKQSNIVDNKITTNDENIKTNKNEDVIKTKKSTLNNENKSIQVETKTNILLDKQTKVDTSNNTKQVEVSKTQNILEKVENTNLKVRTIVKEVLTKSDIKQDIKNTPITNDIIPSNNTKEKVTDKSELIQKDIDIKPTSSSNTNSLLNNLILQTKEKISAKNEPTSTIKQSPLKAEIFLKNQTSQKKLLSSQKVNEVKQILTSKDTTVQSIKQSAKTLDLNIDEVKIVTNEKKISPKIDEKQINIKDEFNKQNNLLDKIFLNKFQSNKKTNTLKDINIQSEKKSLEIASTQTNTNKIDKEIDIIVENSVAQTITTKIIESKQKLNSFISDVAKKMYLNYKPPVTAFKFNLTPINLGNIAITMRSNKNSNSISVSLKMTKQNTLEVFSDNRLSLQTALNKSFDNSTNIEISLDMQESDSNNSFEQFNQQQNNNDDDKQANENDKNTQIKEEQIEDQSYM